MRICTLSPRNTKTKLEYCRPADAQACDAECQWTYIDAVAGPPKIQVACSPRDVYVMSAWPNAGTCA